LISAATFNKDEQNVYEIVTLLSHLTEQDSNST